MISAYLNLPCRTVDEVLQLRTERRRENAMPAIVDDLVFTLVDERFRIEAETEASAEGDLDPAVVDLAGERIAAIDGRLSLLIATTAAGVTAQLKVLRELGWGVYSADDVDHSPGCVERLIASIAAGVERLASDD